MGRFTASLSDDIRLDVASTGPALSVHLDDEEQGTVWEITVDVRINEGRRTLGRIITTPPAIAPPRSRVVALAMCPGALEWFVTGRLVIGGPRAEAECMLASSRCCPGLPRPGVVAVEPYAVLAHDAPFVFSMLGGPLFTIVPRFIGLSAPVPSRLRELRALRTAGAMATYLQIWPQVPPPVVNDPATLPPLLIDAAGVAFASYAIPLPLPSDAVHLTHSTSPTLYVPSVTPLWVQAFFHLPILPFSS